MRAINRNILTSIVAIAHFLLLIGCTDENLSNIVATEDVLYVSGDVVRLTGRVIETNGPVDDHGFQISENTDFTSPEIVSLGGKVDGLGRFIGEYHTLKVGTDYFYRSYMIINGEQSVGKIKEFKTHKPSITEFYPIDGVENNTLHIYGYNFTQDSRVIFGGAEITEVTVKSESEITIVVPPITDSYAAEVHVVIQDTTMVFNNPFYYHYGRWALETTFFDNTQIYEAAWIKDGDNFVFGLGAPDRFNLNDKFWKLDMLTYTWTELNFPGAGNSTTRLPFTSGPYWGTGDTNFDFGPNQLSNQFWKYENGNFLQMANLPFRLVESVGLHVNNELYVFGGQLEDYLKNKGIFKYDSLNDSWDLYDVAPIEILGSYPAFSYNGKAYFMQPDGTIWQYDPTLYEWNIVSYFVDVVKEGGVGVVLNDKAYIGLFEAGRQIWEWDIANNSWKQKSIFTGTGVRDITMAAFEYNNKIFFFRSKYEGGAYDPDPHMELWSFDPEQLK